MSYPDKKRRFQDTMATQKSEQVERWTGRFRAGNTDVGVELEASGGGLTACRLRKLGMSGSASASPSNPHLKAAIAQLREYFSGTRKKFDVALELDGTPFQQKVWRAARVIPFGQTRSYWWIAVRIGDPYAMRAVGGALGANPLPLFIPCHRVIRQDGSLGGFTGGLEWKRLLLAHESPGDSA
jgi:methylated-DNA-[protein]-cysteine S-methyltransferase